MKMESGHEKRSFKLFGAVINLCKNQEEEDAGSVGNSRMINLCSSTSGGIASLERHSSFDSMKSEVCDEEVVVVPDYEDGNKKSAECKRQNEIWKRKRGESWSEQEHRAFLVGLEKLGAGKWKRISEEFVPTRTPTQVASHAQKYFIRKAASGNVKRRESIFDTQLPKHAVSSSSSAATIAAVSSRVPNQALSPFVHMPYSMGFRGYSDSRLQGAAGSVAFVPVWQMQNPGHLNPGNSTRKLFNFMPMS